MARTAEHEWPTSRSGRIAAALVALVCASPAAAAPPSLQAAMQATALPACREAAVSLQVTGAGDPVSERLPLDVMIVFDRSGSMTTEPGNEPLTSAKSAANLLVANLDPLTDKVGLTSFSGTATLNAALTGTFSTVTSAVNGLSANGTTNIAGGVLTGQNDITAHGRAAPTVHVMVVLSDGVANVAANGTTCANSPIAPNTCTQDAVAKAASAKAAGTIVFTIGLNLDNITPATAAVARSTLQAMATDAAKYYESPSASDLADIFQDIAAQVTTIAGSNVVVTDVLPAGVHYTSGSAVPAPTSVSGQTLTWNLGIVSIGQTPAITFNVALDAEDPDQSVVVSPDSRVDYTNYLGAAASTAFSATLVTVNPCATPTPVDTATATPTATATDTPTPADTPTPEDTATATEPPTATASATPADTDTATPTPTATPTADVGAADTCSSSARANCRTALKSVLRIKNKPDDSGDRLIWKWVKGQATSSADFGDPTADTAVQVCLYGGTDRHLISAGEIVVGPGSGWSALGDKGYRFLDKTGTGPDGIQKVVLRARAEGKAGLKFKGRGANLPDVALPLAGTDFPLVVQLVTSDSATLCWESRFEAPPASRNTASRLKLKAP